MDQRLQCFTDVRRNEKNRPIDSGIRYPATVSGQYTGALALGGDSLKIDFESSVEHTKGR